MKSFFNHHLFLCRKGLTPFTILLSFCFCLSLFAEETKEEGVEESAAKKESPEKKESKSEVKSEETKKPKEESRAKKEEEANLGPLEPLTDPKELLKLLKEQINQQSIETLRAIVDKIIQKTPPTSAEGHEAVALLRQALLLVARHSVELGNHSEAILYYERWRAYELQQDELDPNTASVLIEVGREYRNVGSSLTAIETFYRAMTLGRQSSADPAILKLARWEVAETTYMMKNWDRARRLYEMFVDSEGDNDFLRQTALYRIGDCWRALGDENEMILSYQRAVANNSQHPYTPEARVALLSTFLQRENFTAATRTLNDFAQAVSQMSPADAIYWKRRSGEVLFKHLLQSHKFDNALQMLQAMEKLDPDSDTWHQQIARWRGLVYIENGEWEKASNSLSAATQKIVPASSEGSKPAAQPPIQLSVSTPNSEYKELCEWVEQTAKRKSDLGLPTKSMNP
jgi:tetratricopeptide (TPR) repeat protein